jgi:tetratricopeptide (TPR) repeat protein
LELSKGILNQIKDINSNIPEVWENLGILKIKTGLINFINGNYEKSVKMYENSLKKFHDFKDMELVILIGRSYFDLKEYKECLCILEKGFEIEKENSILNYDLGKKQTKTRIY